MKISDTYGSSYLKTEDFDRDGQDLTIATVIMEAVGNDEKPVCYFDEYDSGMPLNRTNALDICELYGDDTDDWAGKVINVHQSTTQYQGKRTPCLRVRKPRSGSGSGSGSSKKKAANA